MSAEGYFGPSEQSLVDMIQMWGLNNTTGILVIKSGHEEGEVHFDKGRAVWAKSGDFLEDEDAIYHMLALREGKFRFVNTNHIENKGSWSASYQQIIMEGMRRLDHINDEMRDIEEKFGLIPYIKKDPSTIETSATEKIFLELVDGKRNLEKVLNYCGLGVHKRVEIFSHLLSSEIIGLRKVRILVVDDQAMWRKVVSNMLSHEPCFEVVGLAEDGIDALKKLHHLKPDVMTLDLEMPNLDGIKTLYWMMSGGYDILLKTHYNITIDDTYRCPVIVISAITTEMAPQTLEALMGGALGYITKPSQVVPETLKEQQLKIAKTVMAASQVDLRKSRRIKVKSVTEKRNIPFENTRKIICCAASVVGGLNSLMQLIPSIPGLLDAAIMVVIDDLDSLQHAKSFAEFLDRYSELSVEAAEEGSILRRGTVYISPGSNELTFGTDASNNTIFNVSNFRKRDKNKKESFRPVDDMLMSAIKCRRFETKIGLVLAGDGPDGKVGFLDMVKMGGKVFAQDSYSSLNTVKPESIACMGIAKIVSLDDMVSHIVDEVGKVTY
ncbi:MAG: response regulator [Deltaproteobacteria bacterium]|nr:response regulator [Deltaproteobacteria bacterium]